RVDDNPVLRSRRRIQPAVLRMTGRTKCRAGRLRGGRASRHRGRGRSRTQSHEHRPACSRCLCTHKHLPLKVVVAGAPSAFTALDAARLHGSPNLDWIVQLYSHAYREARSTVARAITFVAFRISAIAHDSSGWCASSISPGPYATQSGMPAIRAKCL